MISEVDLTDAPEQYLEQYSILLECKETGNFEKLATAREEFSAEFPLLPSIWLDWIDYEITQNGDNHDAIDKLFARALIDFQSVDVCLRYINWAVEISMDFALQKLETISQIIGLHPVSSSFVWDTYLDILKFIYESLDENELEAREKSRTKIIKLFERALKIPQNNVDKLFDAYTAFVGEHNVSATVRNSFETSLKIYIEKLAEFEDGLINADDKSEVYDCYIAYEMDGGILSRIQFLFERAIVDLPFSENLWLQYTTWLDSHKLFSISVYDRACKLCYSCVALWQQSLLALERSGIEYGNLLGVWESAKAAIQSEEECVSVYRTFIYLTHRNLVKTGAASFDLVEKLFKEALKFIKEEFSGNESGSIQFKKNFAFYLYSKSKKPVEARSVWNEVMSVSGEGNKAYIWQESINMERNFGDVAYARRLFYIAVNSVTDHPHDIFSSFIQFEREEGTLEQLDKALEKVNTQARRFQLQQQQLLRKPKISQHQHNLKKRHSNSNYDTFDNSPKKIKSSIEGITQQAQKTSFVDVDGFKMPFLPPPRKKNDSREKNDKMVVDSDATKPSPSSLAAPSLPEPFKYNTGIEVNKLFVRNVDFTCTEDEIKKHFSKFGRVENVRIVTHKDGKPKGVAYVDYFTSEEAQKGLQANNTKLNNRKLKVFISNPPPKGEKRNDFATPKPSSSRSEEPAPKLLRQVSRAGRLDMIPRSLSKNTLPIKAADLTDTPSNGN